MQRTRTTDYGTETIVDAQISTFYTACSRPNETSAWSCNTGRNNNPGYVRSYSVGQKVTSDVKTPAFAKQKNSGVIINNPFSSNDVRRTLHPLTWSSFARQQTPTYSVELGGNVTIDMSIRNGYFTLVSESSTDDGFSTARNRAITAAFANVNEASVQALVTAAELNKSIKTIQSVLFKANTIIRTLASKKKVLEKLSVLATKRGRRKILEELRDAYLEARYGLRPLYYDVNNIMQLVGKGQNFRTTVTGMATGSKSSTRLFKWGGGSFGYASARFERTNTTTVQRSCRCYVYVEYVLSQLQAQAWGAMNLLGTAWELIPFSFIVDWFLNTGNFFASLEPISAGRALATGVTVTDTIISVDNYKALPYSPSDVTSGSCTNISQTRSVTRSVDIEKPLLPSVKIRLNKLKLLDLLAIFGRTKQSI